MTNYNERLDEILIDYRNVLTQQMGLILNGKHRLDIKTADKMLLDETKQAITSLIKELVAEAKPELPALFAGLDDISVIMYKKGTDEYEANLLEALEEV